MAQHTKTGIESVIEMFRVMEPSEAERLLENLAKQDPGLVEKIRANLFVFADLSFQADATLQLLLREVPLDVWVVALRKADDELLTRVLANLPRSARENLEEERATQRPILVSEIEKARKKILDLAAELEKQGKLGLLRKNSISP
jgi:flagellar motor switch protein FliG